MKIFWPNFETGSNSLVGPEVIKFLTGKDSNIFSSFQIDDSEEVDQEPEVFQKKKPSRSARWAQKIFLFGNRWIFVTNIENGRSKVDLGLQAGSRMQNHFWF